MLASSRLGKRRRKARVFAAGCELGEREVILGQRIPIAILTKCTKWI
jgi:hypothetical protein